MKTMVCDMCGIVAEKDNPVGRYAVTLRLMESTNEVDHELEEEANGYIDLCEECSRGFSSKMADTDV